MDTTHNISILNSTTEAVTTQNDGVNYWQIERWISVGTQAFLIPLGSFGNILTIIVMRRGSLKDVSTCFYMSVLAVADTGMLWAGYFPGWLSYLTNGEVNAYAWTKCGLVFFCWYFFRHYSSSLLTMMTVEKFIALYFPFKTKSVCTVRTAKWATGIAGVFYALINIFWFFVVKVETSNEGKITFCYFREYYIPYALHVTKIDATLYAYLPFATMGLCNMAIIYKFVKAKLAAKRGGTESTNQALSSAAMRGTAILITVTITFLILTVPTNIILSISIQTHPLLSPFLYFLVCLNHSINGFLYCIVGTRFRKELFATLCCNRKKLLDTESGKSNATSLTNVKSGEN